MKKLIIAISVILAALCCISVASCSDDKDTWEEYTDWREQNAGWIAELQAKTNPDGTPYYKTVVPSYAPGTFVLLHTFGDPEENAGKLTPLYTSTVDVRYKLHLCDGTPVDSSSTLTSNGPGIFRTSLTSVILGWPIALCGNVHCGDSVEIICPYEVGYGSAGSGAILPYSALRFNIRLVDIPYYEAPAN